MTGKIKASQRTKMLLDYVKTGIVPEGFYVITDKNNRIQFRKIKQPLDDEGIKQKILKLEAKIKELKTQLVNKPEVTKPQTAENPQGFHE